MAQNSSAEGEKIKEDKWKLALDAAGDGMWDLDMVTNMISFSEKWHDMFGYDPSEVSTLDQWLAKIHPEDRPRYKRASEEHIAGRAPSYVIEQRFLCKDGYYKWILSRGTIISRQADGTPLRAVGTHHDINDQKIMEADLKTSRDTFASVFEHSGIGIALLSPDGKWLNVNNVICEMTGYTKEELLKITHYDVTVPEDREIDRGLVDHMLDGNIDTYTIEKRYLSKKKKVVVGLLTTSLVFNADGSPNFFICQVIDITKKKELENDLRMNNAELEATKAKLLDKIKELEQMNPK